MLSRGEFAHSRLISGTVAQEFVKFEILRHRLMVGMSRITTMWTLPVRFGVPLTSLATTDTTGPSFGRLELLPTQDKGTNVRREA